MNDKSYLSIMKRVCLECGIEIHGRRDKKFCTDQCRNDFNNKNNADSTNYIRNVNRILRKNRRILAEICPEDKKRAQKDYLLRKGLVFDYCTNIYTTKDGRIYYYCYDYAYSHLDNDWYLIVKKKEE